MLHFDIIDISEGIYFNKTSKSKEYVFHSWYFLNKCFKFQLNVCNRCHDLLMMSVNFSDISILNIKGADYHFIMSVISKNEAINLMQHVNLTEKSRI